VGLKGITNNAVQKKCPLFATPFLLCVTDELRPQLDLFLQMERTVDAFARCQPCSFDGEIIIGKVLSDLFKLQLVPVCV
jgi:hypothetical protein